MTARLSAEEARQRLQDALLRLLRHASIGAISVRQIAAEAGINHGLIHRYFGSKEGLLRAAVRSLSDEIHRGTPAGPGMSAWSFAFLRERPELARVLARVCLDGPRDLLEEASPRAEDLARIVAPIRTMLDNLGLAGVDPHVLNALATSAFLGWFVFHPFLREGFGLPEDAEDQLAGLLTLLDGWLHSG